MLTLVGSDVAPAPVTSIVDAASIEGTFGFLAVEIRDQIDQQPFLFEHAEVSPGVMDSVATATPNPHFGQTSSLVFSATMDLMDPDNDGKLLIQKCKSCGVLRHPPRLLPWDSESDA